MKKNIPILVFVITILSLIAVFSCDENQDQREQTRRHIGEPDGTIGSQYATYEMEYWIYAQRDIAIIYQFRRTISSCGGNSKWYMASRYDISEGSYYEYYKDYFGYELYDATPVITHEPVITAQPGSPVTIEATITLSEKATVDTEVTATKLFYRAVGDSNFVGVSLTQNSEDETFFASQIPLETVTTAGVEYYIAACSNEDTVTSYHWSRLPEASSKYFTIDVTEGATATKAGYVLSTNDVEYTGYLPDPGDGAYSITPLGQ